MENKKNKKGLTVTELVLATLIMSMLIGFIWNIYFSGRETMRHTVSQSAIQNEARIFLDHLEMEMSACYSFIEVDEEESKFSFYSFTFGRVDLDQMLYDTMGRPRGTGADSDQFIRVVKYEYEWVEDEHHVIKSRTPGNLKFLRDPMEFVPGRDDDFSEQYRSLDSIVVLRDIANFEVIGYKHIYDLVASNVETERVDVDNSSETVFIVLKLHTLIDEHAGQRDEELELVTKFYSQYQIVKAANPGWFSTTDSDGRF